MSSSGIRRAAAGRAVVLSVHPIRFGSKVGGPAISPLDLVELGLVKAEEARDLHAMETATVATSNDAHPHDDLEVGEMMGSRRVARRTARRVDRRR